MRITWTTAKTITLKLMLSAMAVFALLLVGEVVLRVAYAFDQRNGGTLQQRLEESNSKDLQNGGEVANLSGLVQPSPWADVVYELKPNLNGMFRGAPVRTNRHHMRGPEVAKIKPPGTFRIVGIGDSIMFGWGVDHADSYLAVVARTLNERAGRSNAVEALNFAVPGYNTTMEVELFERRALAFDPDLVIIQLSNNDFGVPHFMLRTARTSSLRHFFLLELIRTRLGWLRHRRDAPLVDAQLRGLESEDRERVIDRYRHMVGADGYERAMDRLAALSREKQIPVLVLRGTLSSDKRSVVDRVIARHGFEVLEITPYTDRVLTEEGVENTRAARARAIQLSVGDSHPNVLGHQIYAIGILEKLEAMGLPQTRRQESADVGP